MFIKQLKRKEQKLRSIEHCEKKGRSVCVSISQQCLKMNWPIVTVHFDRSVQFFCIASHVFRKVFSFESHSIPLDSKSLCCKSGKTNGEKRLMQWQWEKTKREEENKKSEKKIQSKLEITNNLLTTAFSLETSKAKNRYCKSFCAVRLSHQI